MNRATIATVVEGHGEVAAVPVLLRRMAAQIVPDTWVEVPRPYRVGRGSLLAPYGLERAVAAVAEHGGPATGVLVLLDADDDCPAELGPELLARAHAARPDRPGSVVLANREFEAWLVAAAPSLRGRRGLATDLTVPVDAEQRRDCKGWLSEHRTDGRSYKPASDQAALTAVFDLQLARKNSRSFDKLWRDVERLLREAAA
ncbi:MAG: DUF4276 family protein [Natronosporangium sp.]